jgi:hypothetical protein
VETSYEEVFVETGPSGFSHITDNDKSKDEDAVTKNEKPFITDSDEDNKPPNLDDPKTLKDINIDQRVQEMKLSMIGHAKKVETKNSSQDGSGNEGEPVDSLDTIDAVHPDTREFWVLLARFYYKKISTIRENQENRSRSKIRSMIHEQVVKAALKDLNKLDPEQIEHKLLADFFIEELNDDPHIELKARIDQCYE